MRLALRRVIVLGLAVLVLLGGLSLGQALAAPGTQGLGVRLVEWVRGHGGGPFVSWAEREWYSHHPPPVGGRPAAGLLRPSGGTTATTSVTPTSAATLQPVVPHLAAPGAIPQLAGVNIGGEGVWHPLGPTVDGVPAMYDTYVAPDSVHTSLVTGVVWMDQKMLAAQLYAGWQDPGDTYFAHSPLGGSTAVGLVAAFNAGFRLGTNNGGWYSQGRMAVPLVNGSASLVIYKNGTATVADWGRDAQMGPNIASVRQNLSLIVDRGQPVPGLSNNNFLQWGATLGGALYVWRSAVGVTANGALIYAGGPGMSITSLADVMVRAGAVRAMEMDINTDWVNFFSFTPAPGQLASAVNASKLISTMIQPTSRYFAADPRDFVGMYLRPGLGGTPSGGRLSTQPAWSAGRSTGSAG